MSLLRRFRLLFVRKYTDKPPRAVPDYGRKVKHGKPYLPYMETHLCDHCNLACKGCGHCCPLAPETFADVEQFERDVTELARKIFIGRIRLMGGEPLLHPDLGRFISAARQAFPKSEILVVTNGVLLGSMKEDFWECLRRNRVRLDVSRYPLPGQKYHREIDRIEQSRGRLGHAFPIQEFVYAANPKGDSDIEEVHRNCTSNVCANLWNSRMYSCPACYRYYYNQYFGENIDVQEGWNIYSTDGAQLVENLAQPFAACRYCDPTHPRRYRWEASKKDRSEWM